MCLGHQLAAQAHVSLIRRAVRQVLDRATLPRDPSGKVLGLLAQACRRIEGVGPSLEVRKHSEIVATGWDHPYFAVGPNEFPEVGDRTLQHYQSPDSNTSGVPQELISAHEVSADDYEGAIDTTLKYERDIHIAMFTTTR